MATRRNWVIVASRDHARLGVSAGFVMANHGKRSPLARMSPGDGILIYSPTTSYPHGEPLRAVTIVGEVTGDEPEPSDVIAGGFRRAASLREIDPLPLGEIREHLPVSHIRFGFFELDAADAEAIWTLIAARAAEQGPSTANAARAIRPAPVVVPPVGRAVGPLSGKWKLAYDRIVGDVFKALADPTRRALLDELLDRDGQTLFELCSRLVTRHGLGSTRQAVSQHLDVLENAGLVTTRRQGRYKFHHLDTAPLHVIVERWLTSHREDQG